MVKLRPIPWTERFRPRSLDEVIMSKSSKERIIQWWRAWVVLWNLRIIWNEKYGFAWFDFIHEDVGKKFWRKYKKSWREHFLKQFEKWIKSSTTQAKIFKEGEIAEVKKTAKPVLNRWLESVWTNFLTKNKIEEKDIPVPPLPPYKPLLLIGPPGTGKTTTALALANDEGVFVIEFNASDERSQRVVSSIVKESSKSAGFFIQTTFPQKPPRLILLDEVDGMSAQRDRGGFAALLKILEDIKLPPILTANVIHDPKVRRLMIQCITIFFDRPRDYEVKKLVRTIARKVKMEVPEDVINYLIKYAPDFRSIVVALETYYYTGRLPSLWHDRMSSLQDAIRMAFGIKSRTKKLEDTIQLAKRYLQESGEDIVDLMLTTWENAWKFIRKDEIFGFYRALADADYYYRIGARKGHWRVAYLNSINLLSYAMAKYGEPSNIWALRKTRINIPKLGTLFMRLYNLLKGEGALGRLIAKLARYMHTSRRETVRSIQFLVHLAENNPEKIGMLFARINCEEESVEAFINEYIKDKKLGKKILKAFKEYSGKVSITGKKAILETLEKEEKKEKKKGEKKKVRSKEEKPPEKPKTPKAGTLDYFLNK